MGKRIHIYIAPQQSESGSACLTMLADYYGKYITLIDAAKLCCVTSDGCNMEQIGYGALALGFGREVIPADPESLKALKDPCIVMVDRQFVILEKITDKKAVLVSPEKGRISMKFDDFIGSCGQEAMYLIPPQGGFEKGVRQSSSYKYALSVIKRSNRRDLWVYGTFLVAISLVMLLLPRITSAFTDTFYGDQNRTVSYLVCKIIVFIAVMLLFSLLFLEINYVFSFAKMSASVSTRCRRDFVWPSLNLALDFYSVRSDGYFMSSAYQALSTGYFLSKQTIEVIVKPIMAMICLLVIAGVSPWSTLTILFFMLILSMVASAFARYEDDRGKLVFYDGSKASGFLLEGLKAIRSIRNSGSEFIFFREYMGLNRRSAKSSRPYVVASAIFEDMPQAVSNITKVFLILGGLAMIYLGKMSYGGLIFIHGVYCICQDYIRNTIHSGKVLLGVRNQLENLGSIYQEAQKTDSSRPEAEISMAEDADSDYSKLQGHVEIRQVTFGYNRYGPPVLEDISMDIPAGSNIALVGASGCGKTTLKKLICGRCEPWEGQILFDGVPVSEIPKQVFVNSIAAVDQQIVLFADTVMNNIKMWDATQMDADAILAARDAAIHNTIILRENAYNFEMSDNGNDFSGGERQRIEIARALSTDPTILIMDEATSALDTIVEKQVVENVRARGITTIVVAHRLSTIRNCDRIYVMDKGRIVDSGTHDELMKSCQLYHTLVTVE